MRWIALVSLACFPISTDACSFCGGNPAGRSTMREEYRSAVAVVFGTLKNPELGSDPTTGRTEFHISKVLKSHAIIEKRAVVILPRYIPVPKGETGETVVFFAERKGEPDAVRSRTSNAAILAYLTGMAKIEDKDTTARLAFAFQHLDSGDESVSDDAFLEFAKASDADITKAKAQLDPTKIKLMLKNPKTPAGRLGVYSLLLGLCGEKSDAAVLAGMINNQPGETLGGLLTGVTLLDPATGWKEIASYALDSKLDFGFRNTALSAVRYMHDTRPKESKDEILKIYQSLVKDPEVAELAIDHLRIWKQWELTDEVLKLYGQPGFQAKIKRNAILRYALTCPEPAAKAFVDTMRVKDAAWVKGIEERMKDLE